MDHRFTKFIGIVLIVFMILSSSGFQALGAYGEDDWHNVHGRSR